MKITERLFTRDRVCISRRHVQVLISVIIALSSSLCWSGESPGIAAVIKNKAEAVWVEPAGEGNLIMYSALQKDVWSPPVQLSGPKKMNLLPTVASDNNGLTFVVWSTLTSHKSSLHYSIIEGEFHRSGPQVFDTGLSSNMAPFLAVDQDGLIWLVWSGNNGKTSDIYFTYWEKNRWHSPQKVHADNSVPDVLPQLYVENDGAVFVKWSTYGPAGYIAAVRKLKEGKAGIATGSANHDVQVEKVVSGDPMSCIKTFPMDEGMFDGAVLLSRCLNEALPRQIRFRK